jgi:hypothetical protein
MHHRIKMALEQYLRQKSAVVEVATDEIPLGNRTGISLGKIVIRNRVMSVPRQAAQTRTSDIARPPSEQNSHPYTFAEPWLAVLMLDQPTIVA